jgi:hypothetical protein
VTSASAKFTVLGMSVAAREAVVDIPSSVSTRNSRHQKCG